MRALTVKQLYDYFDKLIPKELSADWDNDGLMVCADRDTEVNGVMFALDATEEAVERAAGLGYNVIITHHPLIFNKLSELSGKTASSSVAIKALLNGISVFSFHTRLDAVDFGVNRALCDALKIKNAESLGIFDGIPLGMYGNVEKQSVEEFSDVVKNALSVPNITVAKGSDTVSCVAVVGGSGDDCIFAAKSLGVDTFVTGEVHHHIFMMAKNLGMNIISAGHFYTEAPVLDVLARKLQAFDKNIKFAVYNSNPTITL